MKYFNRTLFSLFSAGLLILLTTKLSANTFKDAFDRFDGLLNHGNGYSNYTNLICKNDRTILSSKTLKYYDEQLDGPQFGRIHQSFLVNKKFIKELRPKDHSVLLTNGKSLPVSTRKLKGVMEWLNQS